MTRQSREIGLPLVRGAEGEGHRSLPLSLLSFLDIEEISIFSQAWWKMKESGCESRGWSSRAHAASVLLWPDLPFHFPVCLGFLLAQ